MPRAIRAVVLLGVAAIATTSSLSRAALADAAEGSPLPEVLLSRQLVEQEGLRVGDVVTLATEPAGGRTKQFRLAGQYEPTPDPLKFSARRLEARLHLPQLLALMSDGADPIARESVGSIHVTLTSLEDKQAVANDVSSRVPGLVVRAPSGLAESREIFAVVERFHRAIAVVTVVGSTAFLLALMVIRAEERRDIVGILKLMGIPPRSILVEVLLEGLLIAAAGAVFGIAVALVGQGAVNRFFQWRYDTTLTFVRVTLAIAWQSIALAVPLGVLAGLAASWTLLRRDLASLIRR